MSETLIRISDDGKIMVEQSASGIKSFKQIAPDSLLECINKSLLRGTISSGLLPKGCISYTAHDNGDKDVCILHSEEWHDILYYGTEFKSFPLPRLVFGFRVVKGGRVSSCRLGVIANDDIIKPDTKMFHYPFSNVSGFHLCTGNNLLPVCNSLHTLASLPYYIFSMPNNNDYFNPGNNRLNFEMRDLLEVIKDKDTAFYYSDILIPSGMVLNDFIRGMR